MLSLSNVASIRRAFRQQEGAAAVDRTIAYGRCKIVDILGSCVMDDVRHTSPADTKSDRGVGEPPYGNRLFKHILGRIIPSPISFNR